jgi:single-strand DNA-binding protein
MVKASAHKAYHNASVRVNAPIGHEADFLFTQGGSIMHKTTLIGNLGTDPQQREVGDQTVTNFTMAINERWTDTGGERKERTIWYRVAAWGRLGEICAEHLAKGRKVYVEGRLVADEETGGPRAWTREDGGPGAAFELRAERIEFLDAPGERLQEEVAETEA